MKHILKEPLVHFLILGAALFLLFDLVASEAPSYDSKVISVDRDALLTFVQYRTRAFEPEAAAARLAGMTDEDLDRLISDYVREEALHREAKALGLDKNDYVIKRRMVQSVEFITDGFVTASVDVSDADVAAYYDTHREDYYVSPTATFTHVFVDGNSRSRDDAHALARRKFNELNRDQVRFSDAPGHGDRFPFLVNYVDRDLEFVKSHFGQAMARHVFELQPSLTTWHGPFESEFGLHLVLLSKKAEGRYPALAEIADIVRDDALRETIAANKEKAIQAIVDTYDVQRSIEQPLIRQASQ